MASKSRSRKKSGSIHIGDTVGKDPIAALKNRIAILESELRLKRGDSDSPEAIDRKPMGDLALIQGMVDKAADMVFLLGPEGRILYANEAACKTLGYTLEEFQSMTVFDINQKHRVENWQEHEDWLRKQGSLTFENVFRTKDKRLIPVEISANYARIGDKEYNYSFVRDITERKQMDEELGRSRDELEQRVRERTRELSKSEEKYRYLVETANSIIIRWDRRGNLTFINEFAEKLFGYSKNEVLGKNVVGTIVPSLESTGRDLAALMDDIEKYPERYKLNINENVCKNGDRVWIAWTNKAILDEHGNVKEILSVGNDITERKLAEVELVRANRYINAISKCNAAVIHAKEESVLLNEVCQIIVEVGGYRMAWVGYAETDAKKSVRPMAYRGFEDGYMAVVKVTWDDVERGRGPTGTAIRTGKPCTIRFAVTDSSFLPWRVEALKRGYNSILGLPLVQDGQCLGALTIYSEKPDAFDEKEILLLQDLADNLTHGIVSLRNRRKRREAENALKAAKADAELYVDLMGHDINNMNQIALGYLELAKGTLEYEGHLDRENSMLITKPMDTLRNASTLIDNVRKLQREKAGQYALSAIDLDGLLQEIKRHYASVPGRDITVDYMPCGGCTVKANELLRDVFINLVGNAIKHSKRINKLVVGIRAEKVREDGVDYCRVCVEDNGPGIPDEMKAKLFDRLSLDSTRARGKGFGLCLIKMLVDDYNGQFWVEDRVPGDHTKGARFVVLLPAV